MVGKGGEDGHHLYKRCQHLTSLPNDRNTTKLSLPLFSVYKRAALVQQSPASPHWWPARRRLSALRHPSGPITGHLLTPGVHVSHTALVRPRSRGAGSLPTHTRTSPSFCLKCMLVEFWSPVTSSLPSGFSYLFPAAPTILPPASPLLPPAS